MLISKIYEMDILYILSFFLIIASPLYGQIINTDKCGITFQPTRIESNSIYVQELYYFFKQ